VFFTSYNNQLYAVVHMGVTKFCTPDYKGGTIAAAGAVAGYIYPEGREYIQKISVVAGLLSMGDLRTCAVLSAMAAVAPQKYQVTAGLAALTCSAMSSYAQKKAEFGGVGGQGSGGGQKAPDYKEINNCATKCSEAGPPSPECLADCWNTNAPTSADPIPEK
jgi:hypothetical protein